MQDNDVGDVVVRRRGRDVTTVEILQLVAVLIKGPPGCLDVIIIRACSDLGKHT